MSKTNEEQNQVIDSLIEELESWKRSNDIESPTHNSDIYEFIAIHELDSFSEKKLTYHMREILSVIRMIKD